MRRILRLRVFSETFRWFSRDFACVANVWVGCGMARYVGYRCVEPCDAHHFQSTEIVTVLGHCDDPRIAEEHVGRPKNRDSPKTDSDRDAGADKTETELSSPFNFLNPYHLDWSHHSKGT